MGSDKFYLDGEDAETYGIRLQKPIQFDAPTPSVNVYQVPGRSGDLVVPEDNYRNRKGKAYCYALQDDVLSAVSKANQFLVGGRHSHGYRELVCSNDPTHYWLARVTNGASIQERMQTLNPFRIALDCKPFRYLNSGKDSVFIHTTNTKLFNPGSVTVYPEVLIFGQGQGTVTFGYGTVEINGMRGTVTLDCEIQEAYNGTESYSNRMRIIKDIPRLNPGENVIQFSGGITKLLITPRWADL